LILLGSASALLFSAPAPALLITLLHHLHLSSKASEIDSDAPIAFQKVIRTRTVRRQECGGQERRICPSIDVVSQRGVKEERKTGIKKKGKMVGRTNKGRTQ
jgi:hypothetical protein